MTSVFISIFRKSFIRLPAPAKLVMLVFLMLFFLLIGSLTATLLAIPLFGYELETIRMIVTSPDSDHTGILKYFQITQSIFLFLIPALIAAWLFSENTSNYLKADKKISVFTLTMVIISLFIAVPFMNAVTLLNSQLDLPTWMDGMENRIDGLEESAERLTELFLKSNSYGDLAINFVMIAILPALGEEFLFRGVLQKLFIDWTRNSHLGVILAAFLFSFIHFQFYGFLPRFLLGLYFGYLLVWSSSIWIPVAAHLINNGLAVVYYHFARQPFGDSALDTMGTNQNGNYVFYLSVFFTSVIIGVIYMYEKKDSNLPL